MVEYPGLHDVRTSRRSTLGWLRTVPLALKKSLTALPLTLTLSLFVVLDLGFGDDLLLNVGWHHIVVAEFHRIAALATGHAG